MKREDMIESSLLIFQAIFFEIYVKLEYSKKPKEKNTGLDEKNTADINQGKMATGNMMSLKIKIDYFYS